MNILLISYDYPPYLGGIANISYQIASQLDKKGERLIVVAQKTKGDREFDKNNNLLTYRRTNIFILRELVLLLLLPYLVLRHKIDIIYMLVWWPGGLATYLTSKILGIPYILHAHGLEFIDCKKTWLDKIKYGLFRNRYKSLILRNAKRIIACSHFTKNIVIKLGAIEDNVNIIFNGVDIDMFKPGLDSAKIIARHKLEGKKIILTVSRLKRYKGHETVINLMPALLRRIPDVVYLIIGPGPGREFLMSLVEKLNLQNKVIFIGRVSDSLPRYYNACNLYIMLTKEWLDKGEFEGFGLVFLEANSCGKPVIGAKTGGIPDAIIDGKTGYLVDPNNNQEIIDKISLILENPEFAKTLGEEGRNRIVKEGLTWEGVAKRVRTILASEVKRTDLD